MANSATTKYQDVYTQIRGFISSEKWPLGGTIPSENDLVDSLSDLFRDIVHVIVSINVSYLIGVVFENWYCFVVELV